MSEPRPTTDTAASLPRTGPVVLDWPLESVARITLDAGDGLNTLTLEMIAALGSAVDEATRVGARVAFFTGTGRAFCGGAHIKLFTDPASAFFENPAAIRDAYVRPLIDLFNAIENAPFVTVALVNGFAFGGGCELALACDFRLIASTARIGLTEPRLGAIAAAGGIQRLGRIIGRAKALELLLLGDQWTADDAARIGLVNAVHTPETLEAEAIAIARRLLACSPVTLAESKRALLRTEGASQIEADAIALQAFDNVVNGADWNEGMRAFAERRTPAFALDGVPSKTAGLR